MTKTTKTAVPPLVARLEDVSSWMNDAIEALCRKGVPPLNEDECDRVIDVWYDLQEKQADLFTKWQTSKGLKRLNQKLARKTYGLGRKKTAAAAAKRAR